MARRVPFWAVIGSVFMAAAIVAPVPAQQQAAGQNQPAAVSQSPQDLGATQERLMELLRISPALAEVVSSDPSLLANQDYVARTNPELAAFLAQHPEIPRNPSFWLFSELRSPQQKPYEVLQQKEGFIPAHQSDEPFERVVNDIVPAIVMIALLIALAWVIRTLVENKRWTRVFTLQSDVHGKLIDRFASNQELLGYMETDAGRRFLEAAPIVTQVESRRMPNLVSRLVATLQIGLVLTLLGAGLLALRNSVGQSGTATLVLGIVALMPGIGLILSAGMLWVVGRRLNLMDTPHVSAGREERGRE